MELNNSKVKTKNNQVDKLNKSEPENWNTIVAMRGKDMVVVPFSSVQTQTPPEEPNNLDNLTHRISMSKEVDSSNQNLDFKQTDSEENSVPRQSKWNLCVGKIHITLQNFAKQHGKKFKIFFISLFVMTYFCYFGYALYYNHPSISPLVGLTIFVVLFLFASFLFRVFAKKIDNCLCLPIRNYLKTSKWVYLKWILYALLLAGIVTFIIVDIGLDFKRLTSLGGMLIFIFIGFLTSKYPAKVKWRPVLWGLGLQLTLALLIMRWRPGFEFFQFLGDKVKTFLSYADAGSIFVFGESGIIDHHMAFQIFPIVIYFSAVVNIFYYWGLMQFVVCKIAWLMQFTMGTTAIESLNAACNIFVGMAESCVIMRPFLNKLTKSELHAVMTGGFATVAGSYIAVLVSLGASPEHLISASIMSAPAALAMAKLSYPEVEESHTKTEEDVQMEKAPEINLIQAASNGAIAAINVVASVAANLIAIMGLVAFLDALLNYFGQLVGVPFLSFEIICGYLFWPLSVVMGVEVEDAQKVGSLIGTKIFLDEFVSFQKLVDMNKKNVIADRSKVLATYACCGFGSIAAIGVYIGALSTVAPLRREDISSVAFRAMVNGNVAGFLTACIAGMLYNEVSFNSFMVDIGGSKLNSTAVYSSI